MKTALTSSLKLLAPFRFTEGSKFLFMLDILIMVVFILLLISLKIAFAHGVEGEIKIFSGGVVITATYDTGEPMSYAKVEVYAPDSKIKFQTGRTDRNGRFAFVPDVPGRWRVIVSDGIGHQIKLSVEIKNIASRKIEIQKPPENRPLFISRKIAAVFGILLIFGLFGWIKEIWRIKQRLRPR